MQYIERTLPSPQENLALDEALLQSAEQGQGNEILRLWEWPSHAVVLGSGCGLAVDVHEDACLHDGIPILRRASGGGTVLLGPGCLCFSLVLAYERAPELCDVKGSYRYILARVRDCLLEVVPNIEIIGTSDLAVGQLKFSGNSQQRKRKYLLHHGTVLYAFEIAPVSRYLKIPVRQPEYRLRRGHDAFLRNLPIGREELAIRLSAAWDAGAVTDSWPEDLVRELTERKYANPAWTRKR
jgi:lipoate-protein ligase A